MSYFVLYVSFSGIITSVREEKDVVCFAFDHS